MSGEACSDGGTVARAALQRICRRMKSDETASIDEVLLEIVPLQVGVQDLRCRGEEDDGRVRLEGSQVREELGILSECSIVAQRAKRVLCYGYAVVAVSLMT